MIDWVVTKVKGLVYYGSWTAVIIFIVAVVMLYLFQNKLIYMPGNYSTDLVVPGLSKSPEDNPRSYRSPKEQGMGY
jgi:hypothetical protein